MYHQELLKLFISAILGVLMGLEREMKRKPLGLKTCLVISISSCLLTIVSIDSTLIPNPVQGLVHPDPMRLAAQVISGIGFLGAGVILRKHNDVISGLTTAAMVWASAGLGIAVGAGFYLDACIGLVIIIVSVEFVPFLMRKLGPHVLREREVEVVLLVRDVEVVDVVRRIPDLTDCRVIKVEGDLHSASNLEVTLTCIVDHQVSVTKVFESFATADGVIKVTAESL